LDRSVQRFAYILLILMGMAAALMLGRDVFNYIRAVKGARGLNLAIIDLQVIDDENPRAHVRLRVQNESPLDMDIRRYRFELFLNGERISGSYSTYLGTDPDAVDTVARRESTNIEQVLAPDQGLDLEFTLYIYSTQMEIVRQAQRVGSMSWYASARFTTMLPYSREESEIRLRADFEE
jgi:hypothetical protein